MALQGQPVRDVAYLVNQYPAPTHTFIREEIASLEERGWSVQRFSHREYFGELVDELDFEEKQKTIALLSGGFFEIAMSVLRGLFRSPLRVAGALSLAISLAHTGNRRFIAHIGYFVLACRLSEALQALNYPHLHAHFSTNPAAVALLCHRICGVRFSFTLHASYEYEDPEALNLRQKIEDAEFIVVISSDGYSALSSYFPEYKQKIRLVRCGLGSGWLNIEPTPVPSSRQFLCVARLASHKNIPSLIEAASILVQQRKNFRLVIAGDGNKRAEIERLIAEKGVSHQVILAGWCSQADIKSYLVESLALVLPSQDEGIPVAIMEAFAMGRPAIATDVGGVRELVESGRSGWLVAPGDSLALAEALSSCLDKTNTCLQEMANEARLRVREYDINISAEALSHEFAISNCKSALSTS